MAEDKTALYALTGFLGAGKTTVLRHLLSNLSGKRVGVIQNEFGKLGIDGEILRSDDIEMVEINRGSIFCSCLQLTFVEALAEMAKRGLEAVFVESSGLADPSNIEEILKAVQRLAGDAYAFKGTICLVDALHFLDQLADLETVERQLAHCNLAVISKRDLVSDETYAEVLRRIREKNPVCRVEVADHGVFPLGWMEEDLLLYRWAEGAETLNSPENKPKTLVLHYHGDINFDAFSAFLSKILPSCYRLKGFFQIEGEWAQVDVVGDQIDYQPCPPKEESSLVLISRIGAAIIRPIFEIWEETIGEPMELKN